MIIKKKKHVWARPGDEEKVGIYGFCLLQLVLSYVFILSEIELRSGKVIKKEIANHTK